MQTATTLLSGLSDGDRLVRELALRDRPSANQRTLDDVIGNIKLAYRAAQSGYTTEQGLVGDTSDVVVDMFRSTLNTLFQSQVRSISVEKTRGQPHAVVRIIVVF